MMRWMRALWLLFLPAAALPVYAQPMVARDIVFADFESGTSHGWTLEGDGFGSGPEDSRFLEGRVRGCEGTYYLSSLHPSPVGTGKATSQPFIIERNFITFLIGGGRYPGECCINLLVGHKIVRSTPGTGRAELEPAQWEVADLIGQEAQIEVVDSRVTRPLGFILVDHILFSDGTQAMRAEQESVRAWLKALDGDGKRKATEPLAVWKMLFLIYPKIDSDYVTPEGAPEHTEESLTFDQITDIRETLKELPALIEHYTQGWATAQITVEVVPRAIQVNRSPGRSGGFQIPDASQYRPDLDRLDRPAKYDSVFILFNQGKIAQTVARAMGIGSPGGTQAWLYYGSDSDWIGSGRQSMLKTLAHEWIHGLDNFYRGLGYAIEPMHHLYRYSAWVPEHRDWYSALMRGLLLRGDDTRYGFSRSVWLAGTPRARSEILPCQLLSPPPGAQRAPNALTLRWSRTAAPDGYHIRVFRENDPATAVFTAQTTENVCEVPEGKLPPGDYLWTAQARDKDKLSAVGDLFSLRVVETEKIAPPTITRPRLFPFQVHGSGASVRVQASVTAPGGIGAVVAEVTRPDGRIQRVPLTRRSPYPEDTLWEGWIWIPENLTGKPLLCPIVLKAQDSAKREVSVPPLAVRVGLPMPFGKGDGLRGSYCRDQEGKNTVRSRLDPLLDFDWGLGSPLSGLPNDHFSVVWSGELEPPFTEVYTFETESDDGMKVYLNDQLIVSDWRPGPLRLARGTALLEAGKRYKIRVEYYDNLYEAAARLYWSSPSTPRSLIPAAQLYSGHAGAEGTAEARIVPSPFRQSVPSAGGKVLILADIFGAILDDAWAEITTPEGKTDTIALRRRGWDDVDLFTRRPAPRSGVYVLPANMQTQAAEYRVVCCARSTYGTVVRAAPFTLTIPPKR